MKIVMLVLLAAVLSCETAFTQGIIANRSALNALLAGNRVDEGFEAGQVPPNSAVGSDGLLSSTNSWGGDGFNLIAAGITIESTGAPATYGIQWNGNNYRGVPTKTITAGTGMTVDFWNYTPAFGLDFKDYAAFRTVNAAGITIYGVDDTTVLYSDSLAIPDPNGTFFGYEYAGGIGSVLFSVAIPGLNYEDKSPVIDNFSFSTTAVPEPMTFSLAVIGAATLWFIRRRK